MSTALILPNCGATAGELAAALADAERIAARDGSSLYATSRFFEDRARYDAFCAMYAVMRVVDDAVDDVPDKARLAPADRAALRAELDAWEARVRAAYAGAPRPGAPLDLALAAAVATFPVPLALWLAFLDAMRFDVDTARFEDFAQFTRYGEGATVAPTAIYVYLLTAQRDARDGRYLVAPDFDFMACGRDLGLFAYVAHVLRDVAADLAVGAAGLLYLARADLAAHGLTELDLRAMAARGAGDARWRALVRELCARARQMCARGAALAEARWPLLPRDCAFVFCLIVGVYAELLARIDAAPDAVWQREPLLTQRDRLALAHAAAARVGYVQPSPPPPRAAPPPRTSSARALAAVVVAAVEEHD